MTALLPPLLGRAAHAAIDVARTLEVNLHYALERQLPSFPTNLGDVPRDTRHLTSQWLTEALCSKVDGAEVVGFRRERALAGPDSREVLEVSYNELGQAAGLPQSVLAKSAPSLEDRRLGGLVGLMAAESRFYSDVRSRLTIVAPTAFHVGFHAASGRSMLLLEDVERTQEARFASPTRLTVTRELAEAQVRQLASYHSAFWGRMNRPEVSWIRGNAAMLATFNRAQQFEAVCQRGIARSVGLLPQTIWRRKWEVLPALALSYARHRQYPTTLLHNDVHLGNWYVTPDRSMGQHTWGGVSRGCWAQDLSYSLASALTLEDRREWEQDLLRLYLAELAARGVVDELPNFARAWRTYREQSLHGLARWFYALGSKSEIGRHPDDPSEAQDDDITDENIRRLAHAVDDFDSLSLLRDLSY